MKTIDLSRREFFHLSAGAAFYTLATNSLLAAAKGEPAIRLGVLSDIHLNEVAMKGKKGNANAYGVAGRGTFRAALEYFRDRRVDAVVIAGDMADSGMPYELMEVGRVWKDVFPGDKLPDGSPVEKIFVYGNHDVLAWSWRYKDPKEREAVKARSIAVKLEESWKEAFGEEWRPVYHKIVKGHTFLCAHWGHEKELPKYAKAHAAELGLDAKRPFFCVQHPNLKNTLFTYWGDKGCDKGRMTEFLKDYPWAVSFSGHSHMALTDDRSIWQGNFTALNTSTLLQISDPYGREWACVNSRRKGKKPMHMAATSRKGRQGMVVDVFADHLEVDRREFTLGLEAAPLVSVPLPADVNNPQGFAYAAQKARAGVPQFPVGAQATSARQEGSNSLGQKEPQIVVSFPSAVAGGDKGRVLLYRVEALDDKKNKVGTWQLAQELHFHPVSKIPTAMQLAIGADEVPAGTAVTFQIVPLGFFRQEGSPISCELRA